MKFIKNPDPAEAAGYIADAINTQLNAGEKVLWLLSGGSAIKIAVEAVKLIDQNHLSNVTVTLADERYGVPGHKDSNWYQLQTAGFNFNGLASLPVLQGKDVQLTKNDYENMLARELGSGQFVIGLFGIGPDGHTAGILPQSPAVESQQLVSVFQGPDYQRITITGRAIALVKVAVVYAVGETKREALLKLEQDLSIREEPAQALKLAKQLVIFNDQVGGTL